MRISRLFTALPLQADSQIALGGEAAHYLGKVLRLTAGAQLVLFNGLGREWPATITTLGKNQVTVQTGIARTPATESPLFTVVGIGISRGDRMDYIVQKSTELGVNVIAPLFTEYCEVKLSEQRQEKRVAHWQQVAISACEQSGRVVVPQILAPQLLDTWLLTPGTELKLLCDQDEAGTLHGAAPTGGVALLIGPEGGLSQDEIARARQSGFVGINLGKRVLRTETAPVTALSILQHLWG